MAEIVKYGEEYFQKSYTLLYPLLGITKDTPFRPKTYLFWNEGEDANGNEIKNTEEDINNFHLIVYFEDKSTLFDIFARGHLQTHPVLISSYSTIKGNVFLFDIVEYSVDIAHFLYGDYSRISDRTKAKIMRFHGININGPVIPNKFAEIALYPEKYYKVYSEQYGYTSEKELKKINRELVPLYDRSKETFQEEYTKNWQAKEKYVYWGEEKKK